MTVYWCTILLYMSLNFIKVYTLFKFGKHKILVIISKILKLSKPSKWCFNNTNTNFLNALQYRNTDCATIFSRISLVKIIHWNSAFFFGKKNAFGLLSKKKCLFLLVYAKNVFGPLFGSGQKNSIFGEVPKVSIHVQVHL